MKKKENQRSSLLTEILLLLQTGHSDLPLFIVTVLLLNPTIKKKYSAPCTILLIILGAVPVSQIDFVFCKQL